MAEHTEPPGDFGIGSLREVALGCLIALFPIEIVARAGAIPGKRKTGGLDAVAAFGSVGRDGTPGLFITGGFGRVVKASKDCPRLLKRAGVFLTDA